MLTFGEQEGNLIVYAASLAQCLSHCTFSITVSLISILHGDEELTTTLYMSVYYTVKPMLIYFISWIINTLL